MVNVIVSTDAKKTLEERNIDIKMLTDLKERLQDNTSDVADALGFSDEEVEEHIANLEVVLEQLQEMAIESVCVASQIEETEEEEHDE